MNEEWVTWSEPWPLSGSTEVIECVCAVRASDIARFQRAHEPRYESDEAAILDFLIVHWAKVVTLKKS